jgi:YVTN family beta-propeller protein
MTDLPRGAVTFLFTDIEGSTRLVKQLRDDYGEVLAAHQQLLRQAFANHGGFEIDTQGDAFFVAFSSAREAVLAAVEGQRALSGYPWPNEASVKVRMGIHTGQAAPVDGRYTGLAVHRAARICAAGHGGQVLVSQATQTLLEDEEEDLAVSLDDLGTQRLKDLDRPVQLYQVAGPGLEADFPPIRGVDEPRAAPAEPASRRPRPAAVAAALAVLVAVALAAVLLTRGGGGSSTVAPNSVAAIDPASNRVTAQVPVGLGPGPLAIAAGQVWVGNERDRTLTRLDAATHANAGTVTLNNQTPTSLAAGTRDVWVCFGLLGLVGHVDPGFGLTDTVEAAGPGRDGAVDVGGGFVWAAFSDSTLAQIGTAPPHLLGTGVAGNSPSALVYANGAVWVASRDDNAVLRFDPATYEEGAIGRPISVGAQPVAIAFDGTWLWVANAGDHTLTRIDPVSRAAATVDVGDSPTSVAAGGGAVWVGTATGKVVRVDAATRDVVKTIDVGNPVGGVAVGAGSIWVSVQARD